VPYLRQWLDKYAPIMRRAELHDEVIDFFYVRPSNRAKPISLIAVPVR